VVSSSGLFTCTCVFQRAAPAFTSNNVTYTTICAPTLLARECAMKSALRASASSTRQLFSSQPTSRLFASTCSAALTSSFETTLKAPLSMSPVSTASVTTRATAPSTPSALVSDTTSLGAPGVLIGEKIVTEAAARKGRTIIAGTIVATMIGLFLAMALISSEAKTPPKAQVKTPPKTPVMFAPVKAADVTLNDGAGKGSRTATSFAREVEALRPFLTACANEDGKEGRVTFTVVVAGDGNVTSIDAPAAAPKMQSCLRGTLTSMHLSVSELPSQTITITLRAVKGDGPRPGTFVTHGATKKVVQDHMSDIQACYDMAPPSVGDGDVTMRFVVDADGGVYMSEGVGMTAGFMPVVKCLEEKSKKWKWPAPLGGRVVVTHPFQFHKIVPPPPAESR
jgi:hypothetical protein